MDWSDIILLLTLAICWAFPVYTWIANARDKRKADKWAARHDRIYRPNSHWFV